MRAKVGNFKLKEQRISGALYKALINPASCPLIIKKVEYFLPLDLVTVRGRQLSRLAIHYSFHPS